MIANAIHSPPAFEIRRELFACLERLIKASGASDALVKSMPRHIENYCRSLSRVERAKVTQEKRAAIADKIVLNSYSAHLSAALRAAVRKRAPLSSNLVLDIARETRKWLPSSEDVWVRLVPRKKGGVRAICNDGPVRTAQRLLVRDALSVLGVDSDLDCSRKGAGGEQAFIQDICKSIESGQRWLWTPDVKSFFASLRPNHFKWIPLKRWYLLNVVFLPKCAKVWVILPKDPERMRQALTHYPTYDGDVFLFTSRMVRQGLPQGSVLSPLLARGLLGRELQLALGGLGVTISTLVDDMAIRAGTLAKAVAAKDSVTKRLSAHPAGAIELHEAKIIECIAGSKERALVLGNVLSPGQGLNGGIHVKPGRARIKRFQETLTEKLTNRSSEECPYAVAEKYWQNWFPSQTAWTKIPCYSANVSLSLTYTFVDDYLHGVEMGCG